MSRAEWEPGAVYAPQHRPMHDPQEVDVNAWAEQWWSCLAELDEDSAKHREAERYVAAQLGMHPAVRDIDVDDLNIIMGALRLVGDQNPHNAESGSAIERHQHEEWEALKQFGMLTGRQIVRNTLEYSEGYVIFRMERERSGTDYLTGLLNRRGFVRRMRELYGITDAPRRRNEDGEELPPVNLTHIYSDANGFRWINNNLGHNIGDAAILEASWEFSDMLRESDVPIVYRHGGDEFGALLVGLGRDEVENMMSRIVNRQITKALGSRCRRAIKGLTRELERVDELGRHLRVEARRKSLSDSELASGKRPHHTVYINGRAVAELRDLVTLSVGARSAPVSGLSDAEELRRLAELEMGGVKRAFHGILSQYYADRPAGSR